MLKKLAALVSVPLLALSLSACSGGGDDSAGASKEDVTKGMSKYLKSYLESAGLSGLPDSAVDAYAKCIVDATYDSLSAKSRDLVAKGDLEEMNKAEGSQKEADAVEKAVTDCQDTLMQELMK